MDHNIRIKMNTKLYLRNPEESALGKKIVNHGLKLINKLGFEEFTFKKLANEIGTTEASVYRYFENKHRLLVYLVTWYWSFVEYRAMFSINNIKEPHIKLKKIIEILVCEPEQSENDYINEKDAYQLVMWEGSKAFMTRNVARDNKDKLFKPYKDLCLLISTLIKEYNPSYRFPNSLASTVLEMSHAQKFFMQNLPSLTDVQGNDDRKLVQFIEHLVFQSLDK
jgi:AcrR family transcriptional regulator